MIDREIIKKHFKAPDGCGEKTWNHQIDNAWIGERGEWLRFMFDYYGHERIAQVVEGMIERLESIDE